MRKEKGEIALLLPVFFFYSLANQASQLKRSVEREIYIGGGGEGVVLFACYKYFELKCDKVDITILIV